MNDAADVRQLFEGLYESLATGDTSPWADALADDAVVIGTDEAEWWQGKDEAMNVIRVQVQELHDAGVRYSANDPQVRAAADVILVADRPTAVLADGTTLPMRLTVAATRDGGALLIRQLHISVGVANEEVLQQELTV